MPKFKIANKVYNISADKVNDFKQLAQAKGYQVEEVLDEQPIKVAKKIPSINFSASKILFFIFITELSWC